VVNLLLRACIVITAILLNNECRTVCFLNVVNGMRERHERKKHRNRETISILRSHGPKVSRYGPQRVLRPHIGAQRGTRCSAGGCIAEKRGTRAESEQRLSFSFSLSLSLSLSLSSLRYQALLKVHKHREVRRELWPGLVVN